MPRQIVHWLVAMMAFVTSAAAAQTSNQVPPQNANQVPPPNGMAKFREVCGQDMQQFCSAVQPGGGRLLQCLSSHGGAVSVTCRNLLARIPAATVTAASAGGDTRATGGTFRTSCGPDVQRLCATAAKENNGVFKCLTSQRTQLSASCKSFFQQLRARQATQKNNLNDPSPPSGEPRADPPADEKSTAPGLSGRQ
jgi:hypothetical protein